MLFFAKKLPNAQARGRRCVCGQCDGNGGVRNCGGVALVYGPGGPDGPNGQDGRATVYPGGLHAAVWFGAGDDMPPGYAGNVMATAVCETAGV